MKFSYNKLAIRLIDYKTRYSIIRRKISNILLILLKIKVPREETPRRKRATLKSKDGGEYFGKVADRKQLGTRGRARNASIDKHRQIRYIRGKGVEP